MIDPNQALSQFVGSLPTFIAVVLAWLNSNSRSTDMQRQIQDVKQDLQRQIQDVQRQIGDTSRGYKRNLRINSKS